MSEDPVIDTIASYDMMAEEYARRTRRGGDRAYCERMLEITLGILPPRPRVIDMGCGDGRDTAYLGARGADVVGIDLSWEMVRLARTSYPKMSFLQMDLRKTLFPDESFHCAWASASIIHIPLSQFNDMEREVHRILVPDGIFAFSFKLGEGEGFEKSGAMKEHPRYFTYHTVRGMGDLLKKFRIVRIETCTEKVFGSSFAYCWAVKKV